MGLRRSPRAATYCLLLFSIVTVDSSLGDRERGEEGAKGIPQYSSASYDRLRFQRRPPLLHEPCFNSMILGRDEFNNKTARIDSNASALYEHKDDDHIQLYPLCTWRRSATERLHCCCRLTHLAVFEACLPSFIVIGTQKGGSSALFAYFLFHPFFRPPVVKEAHFFDRVPYEDLFPSYPRARAPDGVRLRSATSRFINFFPRTHPALSASFITGEASPSYILVSFL